MEKLKEEEFEAIDGFLKWRKRKKNDNCFYNNVKKIEMIKNEIEASEDLRKNKMLIELSTSGSSVVKQIAVKPQTNVKCITSFLAGTMLMFAKLSLKCFIYQLAELFMFPRETVQAIYDKYQIERVYVFHILINTDSTSIQFIVVSKVQSTFTEPQVRNILFEVFSRTQIADRSTSLTISGNSSTFTTLLIKKFWGCTRWRL